MSPLDELQADLRRKQAACNADRNWGKAAAYAAAAQDTERLRPLIEAAQRVATAQQALLRARVGSDSTLWATTTRERKEALDALCALLPAATP